MELFDLKTSILSMLQKTKTTKEQNNLHEINMKSSNEKKTVCFEPFKILEIKNCNSTKNCD